MVLGEGLVPSEATRPGAKRTGPPVGLKSLPMGAGATKYSGRDLNPHALRHQNLNLACLPISPPEQMDLQIKANDGTALKAILKWWPDPELNWGHKDFQSSALPTELSGHS